MQAESVLLEPYYEFRLTVPQEMVGRALTDIQRMYGEFAPPVTEGEFAVISGSAPVSEMRAYQREVISFTRGLGSLSLVFQGYAPCHNAQAVQQEVDYDPQGDMENPTGSVFCSHGAGFYVPWDQVPDHMHIASQLPPIFGRGIGRRDGCRSFGRKNGSVCRAKRRFLCGKL